MAQEDPEKLEPPVIKSEDTGAHDLESSESDDHFSDAQSGTGTPTKPTISIPHTRVEKVDDEPSYGEEPGTEAYKEREQDATPDEIEIIHEGHKSSSSLSRSKSVSSPGGQPIPMTIVEKVDPDIPSHGEVPGTEAYKIRQQDASPDLVVRAGDRSRSSSIQSRSRSGSTPGDLPIPITKVERVDSKPAHGEVPGTKAWEMRRGDAEPDIMEEVEDVPGSPTVPALRSGNIVDRGHIRRKSSKGASVPAPVATITNTDEHNEEEDGASDDGFGDDFDDFEEGEQAEEFEFGEFDDGFQEAPPQQSIPVTPSFPVLSFEDLTTSEEIQAATEPYLDALFPPDEISTSILPAPSENNIFLTARSASLWSQLVAPPPLQPPNWIRSRIRRLFLVSLGVPVDLDEILPASKQKKLILPSTNLNTSPRESSSISRLKNNSSSTSVDSQGVKKSESKRRKGPPPEPAFDLLAARQLCTVTSEAIKGMSDEELQVHVDKLKEMEGRTKEVLEWWTRRTDELLTEREAFEGVIENLVKHARKVRK